MTSIKQQNKKSGLRRIQTVPPASRAVPSFGRTCSGSLHHVAAPGPAPCQSLTKKQKNNYYNRRDTRGGQLRSGSGPVETDFQRRLRISYDGRPVDETRLDEHIVEAPSLTGGPVEKLELIHHSSRAPLPAVGPAARLAAVAQRRMRECVNARDTGWWWWRKMRPSLPCVYFLFSPHSKRPLPQCW